MARHPKRPRAVKTTPKTDTSIKSLPELFKVGISTFVDSIKNQYGQTGADVLKKTSPDFFSKELTPQGQAKAEETRFLFNYLPVFAQAASRLSQGENLLAPAGGLAIPELKIPFTEQRIHPPFVIQDPRTDEFGSSILARHEIGHQLEPPKEELAAMWDSLDDQQKKAFEDAYGNDYNFERNSASEAFALAVEAGLGQAPESVREAARSTNFFTDLAFAVSDQPRFNSFTARVLGGTTPGLREQPPFQGIKLFKEAEGTIDETFANFDMPSFNKFIEQFPDIAERPAFKDEIIFAGRLIPRDEFTDQGLQIAEEFIRQYENRIEVQKFYENARRRFGELKKIREGEFEVTEQTP